MKVFLDTNVLIDSLLSGRPNNLEASAIISACELNNIEGFASFLTIANIAYIMRKDVERPQLLIILQNLMNIIDILPMNKSQLHEAFTVTAPDFEDVLQYECAKAAGCDVIVTANTKHFKFCKDIEVVSTYDFAQQFTEEE